MQAKLRQVGNSVGVTIPAHELKALEAKPGDIIEIQIMRVIHNGRSGWEDPALWQGADQEPLLFDDTLENKFDNEEWEW